MKSIIIINLCCQIRSKNPETVTVLDIGCGKGGDLLKWQRARVDYVVCADIAATSVDQCENRYNDMSRR